MFLLISFLFLFGIVLISLYIIYNRLSLYNFSNIYNCITDIKTEKLIFLQAFHSSNYLMFLFEIPFRFDNNEIVIYFNNFIGSIPNSGSTLTVTYFLNNIDNKYYGIDFTTTDQNVYD